MVDNWAANPNDATFHSAYAVRQISIGLAGILGLTAVLLGIALLKDDGFPTWLAILALAGGLPTFAGGIVVALHGFSYTAMTINMSASLVLLAWMVSLGTLTLVANVRPRHEVT